MKDKTEFSKLSPGESLDVEFKKLHKRRSYASLMAKREKEKATIDIAVRQKKPLGDNASTIL